MNTEGLVNELVALLNTKFTAQKNPARVWPSEPKAKPTMVAGVCEFWVAYDGSQFKEPGTIDGLVQDRTRRIAIALFVRSLTGNKGAAAFIDAIQDVVHGYRPSDGGPLLCVSDAYAGFDNGVWQYTLVFKTTSPKIPIEPTGLGADVISPALLRVTLDDPVGGTTEVEFPSNG